MDRPGTAKAPRRTGVVGNLDVIYEDDLLIVVNKPAGILTVPLERKTELPSVHEQIEERFRSHGKRRPFAVHRIDQDTSGIVVFAKDAGTQKALKDQFKRREPDRVYRAVVYGIPDPSEGTWRDFLVWDEKALIQKETHPHDPRATEAICTYTHRRAFQRRRTHRGSSPDRAAQSDPHPGPAARTHAGRRGAIRLRSGHLAAHPVRAAGIARMATELPAPG